MMWALDEGRDDLLIVRYPYFRADPLVMQVEGSYARTDIALPPRTEITFTHALGEIITALLDQGLQITGLVEHQRVPWDALPGQMEKLSGGNGGCAQVVPNGCRSPTHCRQSGRVDIGSGSSPGCPGSCSAPVV